MTAEQLSASRLEELQRLVDRVGNDTVDPYDGVSPYFAADLARRVLAAEKMVEANGDMEEAIRSFLAELRPNCPLVPKEIHEAIQASREALTAYHEVSKGV